MNIFGVEGEAGDEWTQVLPEIVWELNNHVIKFEQPQIHQNTFKN